MNWQPIETAPRDGTKILAYAPMGPNLHTPRYAVTWWRRRPDDAFEGWGEFNEQYWPPTHWTPIIPPEGATS